MIIRCVCVGVSFCVLIFGAARLSAASKITSVLNACLSSCELQVVAAILQLQASLLEEDTGVDQQR